MNKTEIRKRILSKLKALPHPTYVEWSNQIAVKLYNLETWKSSDTIAITISRGKEVDTKSIIEKAWQEGKRIVVPKCKPETKEMTFRILESFDQLEVVYYGLEEPKESITKAVSTDEIDAVIVPGVVFNLDGYRIGYGGGYYDRFLTNYNGCTIALAFEMQLVSQIPVEDHDIPVQTIITNERVLLCHTS
ncbi:5-formyltetrahydrofolate cyclo-ligase [Calidifontibacillus erzurumensis]|uniref:5-formyltetrahydrofolate cyclo-ligase n=1 Tax=Calidifontibacillus erzurumensis TaxID=2741433 RepID=UPI0035B516AC